MAENSGSTDGNSRTKPDPYDADAIRQAIEAALKFRNETPYSAAVGAEVAGKNAAQPASAGREPWAHRTRCVLIRHSGSQLTCDCW